MVFFLLFWGIAPSGTKVRRCQCPQSESENLSQCGLFCLWTAFEKQRFRFQVKHLHALVEDDETLPDFDKSIYPEQESSGERLISMVGACKGKYKPNMPHDYRVLEPLDASRPYHHYVIQSLTGTETVLELPDQPRPPTRRRGPVSQGKPSWLTVTESEAQGLALEAMVSAGMRDGYSVGRLHNNVVIMETTGSRPCMHGHTHESNNASVSFRRDGALLYHCNATDCAKLDAPQIGFWRKSLEERLTLDALLPEQRREFDVRLLSQLELAVKLDDPDVKKLTKCRNYRLFQRFCVSYCNLFFAHVFLAKPEVVQFYFDDELRPSKYERRSLGATKEITDHAGAAFKIWMTHPDKRTFEGFFFNPDLDVKDPKKVNLCVGAFPMANVSKEPLDQRELNIIQPLLDLLHFDLCCAAQDHTDYVLNWLALPLQRLGAKTGTAILVFGQQGTGKSLFFGELMKAIYGEFYYIANSKDEILGRFNKALGGRLYLHADEAGMYALKNSFLVPRVQSCWWRATQRSRVRTRDLENADNPTIDWTSATYPCQDFYSSQLSAGFFSGYRDESARLKTLITGTAITIEGKGVDSVQLPNYANLVVTTNETHAVRMDGDDRRWWVTSVTFVAFALFAIETPGKSFFGPFFLFREKVDQRSKGTKEC